MATVTNEVNQRYDVFLCFRGWDTRRSFTGNLYAALRKARLRTFFDISGLKGGDEISPSILEALESSRISIVVLSENFASSIWCLDELVKIIDCMNNNNQLVLPIFYKVDPSHVRHQRCCYAEDMLRLEQRFGDSSERVMRWRAALSQVADISGWHYQTGYEYKFIQDIVEDVIFKVPRYAIFLSFTGKDTFSFTGFLFNALSRRRYDTFMSDGDQTSESIIGHVIEKSRLSIIVFSENYARSSSCLDDLLTILQCMDTKNQLVCPIFYKVLPSDLRHLRNSYAEAMTHHEYLLGKDSEKVKKWRSALFQVANLKGFYLKTGYEYEFIDKIVEMASKI